MMIHYFLKPSILFYRSFSYTLLHHAGNRRGSHLSSGTCHWPAFTERLYWRVVSSLPIFGWCGSRIRCRFLQCSSLLQHYHLMVFDIFCPSEKTFLPPTFILLSLLLYFFPSCATFAGPMQLLIHSTYYYVVVENNPYCQNGELFSRLNR